MKFKDVFIGAAAAMALAMVGCQTQQRGIEAAPVTEGDDIVGVVTGSKGPEAGVWVIAETKDLPTRYTKIVVTDDQGRFAVPDLPKANYDVWVRGYGLVDSAKAQAAPGATLNLRAGREASPKEAAEIYPSMYCSRCSRGWPRALPMRAGAPTRWRPGRTVADRELEIP